MNIPSLKAPVHASGIHGIWHICEDATFFDTLIAAGFKRNKLRNGTPIVEANVMTGIPAKAADAGLYDWPNA